MGRENLDFCFLLLLYSYLGKNCGPEDGVKSLIFQGRQEERERERETTSKSK
jgi:hypothetical protein